MTSPETVSTLQVGDLTVEVVRKDIKNVHLSVYPPSGRVRIAAPRRTRLDSLRVFTVSKLPWIRAQQAKIQGQARESPRDYVERESHYLWGMRYLMAVEHHDGAPSLELGPKILTLKVRPGTEAADREAVVHRWYRDQIRDAVPHLLRRWQPILEVEARKIYVRRMKTKWGSCNPDAGNIRLNTELAKKPPPCLEYILVHELVHLIEPTHNARFVGIMDRVLPQWRHYRRRLNELPVRREDWTY